MTNSKSFVANFVTSLNLFCGFLAIVYTSHGNYKLAAIFIIMAAIFDTLDGIIARLLSASSRFGVELDSLSDVVSFGAAPSFLIYKAYTYQFGLPGIIIGSLILIFGAFRLARFNIMVEDLNTKGDFTGLPIPLSALTISTLVFSYSTSSGLNEPFDIFIIPLILLLSFLMVSKVRYNALPKLKNKKIKEKIILFVTLIIALFLAFATNGRILFFIFLSIVLFGIFRHLYFFFFSKNQILETTQEK
jgi:CDP-diacylglycerol--serine O-phosphatidyltransferase